MNRPSENLATVSTGRERKWKFLELTLGVICLVAYILLAVLFSRHVHPSDQIPNPPTTNITTNSMDKTTSTSLINAEAQIEITSSSIPDHNYCPIQVTSYAFPDSIAYETSSGVSLNNSLYFNVIHECRTQGYINTITLRLFTNWKDDGLLYLFIISGNLSEFKISHRYAIDPQRNTTEWQTIKILSYALPIFSKNFLAIGMQENSNTNEIYIVKPVLAMGDTTIDEDTTKIIPEFMSNSTGVALTYTVIENGEMTTMESP